MSQEILRPLNLTEALQFLAAHQPHARIVNGATDLPHEIAHGVRAPQTLIDIRLVPDLKFIREAGDFVQLGASVTHAHVLASPLLAARALPLVRACQLIRDPQARERGTIAGNVAGALSTNLTIAALWAMGAQVVLKSVRGERLVTFNEFFKGVRQTAMLADEMVYAIAFSKMSDKDRGAFVATGWSREDAQANVTCAVVLEFEGDEISNAWITLGGVAPTVVNAVEAEQALVGQWLNDAAIDQAAELAMNVVVTDPDKIETVRVLVTQALREI